MTRQEFEDFQNRVHDKYNLIQYYSHNIENRWDLFCEVVSFIALIPPYFIIGPGRHYRTKELDWTINSYVGLLWDKTGISPRPIPENRAFSPSMVERISPKDLKYIARCVYDLFTVTEERLIQRLYENLEKTDDESVKNIIKGALYTIKNGEPSPSIFETLQEKMDEWMFGFDGKLFRIIAK
jgi:hypothetical protein